MGTTDRDTSLRREFEPILSEMGFRIVELQTATVHGRVHLDLVVFAPSGVTVDDCAAIHKVIMPRAELLLDDRDVAVQVASPGIDRVLKTNAEFAVFDGRGVSILLREKDRWIGGVIEGADDHSVTILTEGGQLQISFDDIQKARLDHSQEVR